MTTRPLAIDACAALHAKHSGALVVLDDLIARGLVALMSPGVHQECVAMSLGTWLDRHTVQPQRVRRQETKAVRNHCDRRAMPGSNDLELIALARRTGSPVLTHDRSASQATRRLGLVAVDLCDIIAFGYDLGTVDEALLASLSTTLDGLSWHAPDWREDVLQTVQSRARYAQTAAFLRQCLDAEHR